MPAHLPQAFIKRLIDLLQTHSVTTDERETLLTEAFYFADPRPYYLVKREGNARQFAVNCIKDLHDFCLEDERHALECLLETLQNYCGATERRKIEADLLPLVQGRCREEQPLPRPPIAKPKPLFTAPLSIETPKAERQPTVFISYSHKDLDFANQLIADLGAAGYACWIDKTKIKGGDEWVRSITEGINNSYAFISIVSPDANDSTWVRREFLWAEYKAKPILPLMAVACDLTIYLMERQIIFMYADADKGYSYSSGLAGLLSALPRPSLPPTEETSAAMAQEILSSAIQPINRRRLELDYLDLLRAEVLFDLEKYTPLGGISQFGVKLSQGETLDLAFMRPEFAHLRSREEFQPETRRFENAVDEILQIKRAVLLGEPGGGKTTTLLSLAGQLSAVALKDAAAPLPIFVRLGRWTDSDQSLLDFIAGEMGALGEHLQMLIEENRAVPLLDGMNEIPVSQRGAKYPQIERFIKVYPEWIAITSCREQDYTLDLGLDRITITPLDPLRVREFVQRYLGDEKGEALFWRIAGEDARRFETRFQEKFGAHLDEWPRVFWTGKGLPDGLTWKREFINTFWYGWEEWRALRDQAGSLMSLAHNPYMLSMLTQVFVARGDLPPNRGQLFAEFVETLLLREKIATQEAGQVRLSSEAQALLNALARLAYEMQIQRGLGGKDRNNALTALPIGKVRELLDERQVYLAGSSSLLDLGDEVRFSHQLLQEYFAAVRLNDLILAEQNPLQASDIWKSESWWERSNWEEALILLAGFYSDDCSPIVEWVNRANPEVAALCITRSGAGLAEATREKLRAEWIGRLSDLKNEPKPLARAAVGRALGLTGWDKRKGVGVIIRDGLKLPDIDWVEIPAGDFIYQDGEQLHLPTFSIARYPVTYVQFQAFIDDPAGFYKPNWWEGLPIPEGHNSQPGDQAFKYWNHPRERVSWYEALAFCRWLSAKLGYVVTLPTEQQWEKAARGTDGRLYPYAGDFDANKANTKDTGIGQTSAVGIFPQGSSPYGLMDMSGNVFEWCLNSYDDPSDTSISNSRRGLRGGSWYFNRSFARAASRLIDFPNNRANNDGFRLCRPPSLSKFT